MGSTWVRKAVHTGIRTKVRKETPLKVLATSAKFSRSTIGRPAVLKCGQLSEYSSSIIWTGPELWSEVVDLCEDRKVGRASTRFVAASHQSADQTLACTATQGTAKRT